MPYIVVENGTRKGARIEIPRGGSVVLGRDPKAEISVEDHLCSRQHFRVSDEQGVFMLRDLGSSNGTWLNEVRVREAALSNGDAIQAGETQATFLLESAQGGRGLIGKTVGGYRIIERVGRGGMGTVYKANQVSLNRNVALKILSPKVAGDPAFVAKFKREAQAAGRLNHPNIVQCYDVGSEGGLHYYSMEFIENGSVQDLVRKQGRIEKDLALAIILDAARGLEYAEKRKLVHRDVKPDNLMINSEGVVKIADLGLAREADRSHGHDDEGIFGTPHFISPEQATGGPVDTRSDIYSLGASFYYMLCGETPFDGENIREIIRMQIEEDPQPVKERVKGIPASVSNLIAQMMAKDPARRPPSAAALLAQLEALNAAAEGRGRKKALVAALVATPLLLGAAAYLIFGRGENPPPAPPDPGPEAVANRNGSDELAILREQRENDALKALYDIQLAETGLAGAARTAEALRDLAKRFTDFAEDYGPTERLPAASSALEARRQATRLEEEAAEKERAIQAAAEAARIQDEAARTRAESLITASDKELDREEWAAAIDIVRNGMLEPEIAGTRHLTTLSGQIEKAIKTATGKAEETLDSAESMASSGGMEEAAKLLDGRAGNLKKGFDSRTAPGEIFAAARRLEGRADALRKEMENLRKAAIAHDQKAGFEGRRRVLQMARESCDLAAIRQSLEELRAQLKTEPWQQAVDRDLQDLAASERVRKRFLELLQASPPDPRKDRVLLPGATEQERTTVWDLVSADESGVHLERLRGRYKKTVGWGEMSFAEFHRRVFSLRSQAGPDARRDQAAALLFAIDPETALACIQDEEESDPSLLARIKSELDALLLLREIRTLEKKAESDSMAYLQILPKIDRLVSAYRHTLVFLLNSDGSTPMIAIDDNT